MITFNFKNIKINIYTDPIEFINCDEKPFGEIPDDYTFAGVQGGDSTGFASIDLNMISIYVGRIVILKIYYQQHHMKWDI